MGQKIPTKENLKVEFKSDRTRLSDHELVGAVVCLANTEGGEIYLGVEEDGTVSGLHKAHQDLQGLAAMVANNTNPPVGVRVEKVLGRVAKITVPKARTITATASGLIQRRRLNANGEPQCVPFYPYEFGPRQSSLGLIDYSSFPIVSASTRDLDPLERQRIRQMIELYKGDQVLLALSDDELDGALGFVRVIDGLPVPTVVGLLLLGKEEAIREHLPTHEVAIQVMQGTQVRSNEFSRAPLLKVFERVSQQFQAQLEEDEISIDLVRVPIPTFDQESFREAIVNAFVHRDYGRLGTVHTRWDDLGLVISNPGGFVEGVSLENLLAVEPKPRNPRLADAVKRIGLAERTGRGVDLIYAGSLRYGRPEPDYSSTTETTVVVRLSSAKADIPFLKMILEEEKRLGKLTLDALIVLNKLRRERRLDLRNLAKAIQKNESVARSVLESLVERGLLTAVGPVRNRGYILSSRVYRSLGQNAAYILQAGFASIQQEQMILQFAEAHGRIRRRDVSDLCLVTERQAGYLLEKLTNGVKLRRVGKGGGAYYEVIQEQHSAPVRAQIAKKLLSSQFNEQKTSLQKKSAKKRTIKGPAR